MQVGMFSISINNETHILRQLIQLFALKGRSVEGMMSLLMFIVHSLVASCKFHKGFYVQFVQIPTKNSGLNSSDPSSVWLKCKHIGCSDINRKVSGSTTEQTLASCHFPLSVSFRRSAVRCQKSHDHKKELISYNKVQPL